MAYTVQPVQFPKQGDTQPACNSKGLHESNLHVRHPDRKGILTGGTDGYARIQDRVTAYRASKGEKPQDRGKPLKVHDGNMQGHTQT